jgi:hypothetical protein
MTTHDIARLRHHERVALGHAAVRLVEAREARSIMSETRERRTSFWLHWLRRRERATPQTPARTATICARTGEAVAVNAVRGIP